MRRFVADALVAALLVGAGASQAAGSSAHQDAGTVQGTALAANRSPLPNHTVQLRHVQTGQLVGSATTMTGGLFTFAGIVPGSYIVELLNASGNIIGATAPIAISAGTATAVTVIATATDRLGATAMGGGFRLFGMGPTATAVVLAAAAVGITTAVIFVREGKVVICHTTGSTPQTIQVSENSVAAHQAHGDTLGACPASPSR